MHKNIYVIISNNGGYIHATYSYEKAKQIQKKVEYTLGMAGYIDTRVYIRKIIIE